MPDFLGVFCYALLPVVGHGIGATLAVSTRPAPWLVGASLHGSAGIAIALVSMDLMPRIEQHVEIWLMMLLLLLGALLSVALARTLTKRKGGRSKGALMAYIAIGADLVSDGLMTGAGFAVQAYLGLLLAAAQAVANIPGGFAATANLDPERYSSRRKILVAASMVIPVTGSALAGLWLLGDASPRVQHAALMVIVGILLLATVEDMIPEADAPQPARWLSTSAFTLGFAGMALSSHYLG